VTLTSSLEDSLGRQSKYAPPVLEVKEAVSMFHQGVGDGLVQGRSFRLFTSCSPFQIFAWFEDAFCEREELSVDMKCASNKFKVIIQLPDLRFVNIQVWSLSGEEGVFMIEVSIKSSENEESEMLSPISLAEVQRNHWILSSFWFEDILPALSSRGCQEANTALTTHDTASINNKEARKEMEEVDMIKPSFQWFPPQPPPRDDDPFYNETLREELEQKIRDSASDANHGDDSQETTVLEEAGHEDIF
jgi:hypothetical protein